MNSTWKLLAKAAENFTTLSVGGPFASFQKSSSSKERSDDSQSASSSKKRTYRQSLE